jgi:hypothetical protein
MKILNVLANILLLAIAHLTLAFFKSSCTGQDKKSAILNISDTTITSGVAGSK